MRPMAHVIAIATDDHATTRGTARVHRAPPAYADSAPRPTSAASATTAVTITRADAGANVVEVLHERAFGRAPSSEAEVEFVLETRGAEHLRAVVSAVTATGHTARAEPHG